MVINIHKTGKQIALEAREYQIDILGGWGIKLGDFSVSFKNSKTHEIIHTEKAFWPVQSFAFNKKAKSAFVIQVPKSGKYVVECNNPESIIVRSSNLFLRSFFEDPIPNSEVEIYIY